MAKSPPVEASAGVSTPDQQPKMSETSEAAPHPYEFHVSGPRNLSAPNWRDLIRSSWLVNYFLSFPFFFASVLGVGEFPISSFGVRGFYICFVTTYMQPLSAISERCFLLNKYTSSEISLQNWLWMCVLFPFEIAEWRTRSDLSLANRLNLSGTRG